MTEILPQNPDAEEAVLGIMLLEGNAAVKAADSLRAEMFFRESHQKLFTVMARMVSYGIPTDHISVTNELAGTGDLENVGGRARVIELAKLVPATNNIAHYCKIVKDCWKKRLVLEAVSEIREKLGTLEPDQAISLLDQAALSIEEKTDDRHDLVITMERLTREKLEQLEHPPEQEVGIPVPFTFLDPLLPGRLYVLGGYQADGKTAAGLQFVSEAAKNEISVGLVSVEMSHKDLHDRWLMQQTSIPYQKLRSGRGMQVHELTVAREKLLEMAQWPVSVIDDESVTTQSLRQYQRTGKYQMLVIDHLHRMRWKDRHDLENTIRSITNLAREFEIPVLLLAQLSRSGDHARPFPVPTMRQLRETAMLEAEAAAVWFVYRQRDENHLPTSEALFLVAKNRFGPTFQKQLYFSDGTVSFHEDEWRSPQEQEPKEPAGITDAVRIVDSV